MLNSPLKIALYSHDTLGLGHMRRNLAIAQTLIDANPKTAILMIAGAHEISAFEMPMGVDCLTLPTLAKDNEGVYRPRTLGVGRSDLLTLRASTIQTAIEAFSPNVMIVDKVPSGVFGELLPTLEELRQARHTRIILGLRDILDEAEVVHHEWESGSYEAIIRKYYDAIWIYGDPRVYDPIQEYRFSSQVIAKTHYTGYLGRLIPSADPTADLFDGLPPQTGNRILCTVGGGQDGELVARTFLQTALPNYATGILVTGPYMPSDVRRSVQNEAASKPQFQVLPFVTEPERLLSQADRVITMGGYNTVCELLSSGKPALVVPRVKPRREQLIRAERLAQHGALDYLHPDVVTPAAFASWLRRTKVTTHQRRQDIDLDGLKRLPGLLQHLLQSDRRSAPAPSIRFSRAGEAALHLAKL
ncbi:MAG: glycosyltransferase [Anaerolineae bacterium]|nr:glycosyltransferase [Anaerolineae bacterium]